MSTTVGVISLIFSAICLGALAGYVIRRKVVEARLESAEKLAERIIEEAKKEGENTKREASLQAKDELYKVKLEADKESKERKAELQVLEKRLAQKEENLENKFGLIDQKELNILKREKELQRQERIFSEKEQEYQSLLEEERHQLEKISGLTSSEAKDLFLRQVEEEARTDAARLLKRIESETRETADKKAKEVISLAVMRYAGEYVAEKTVSVVNLPNEEMKGRIIGREGRNIRAIEAATGVDLIIDDTPEAVILSGFNPIRREVARIALERLIADGRIHPARIEEIVEKVDQEVEISIKEAGEQATFDVGVHGFHLELIKLIGKLKYRTSYGQNVLQHSIEVAFLCGIMAAELGLNVKKAKRAGLLHDIGKAVDHEVEGTHAMIGADLAKKYGESSRVVHAIAAHHEDVAPESVLDVLIQAADALSGARPGARKETLESYVRRLADLERIANCHPGVNKSFAIQAGREVRIVVDSGTVSDEDAVLLCRDIAKKIEAEMTYPGQIRVTVIRETRAVEYAK
ncbi:MAG: ribonuclease Y [Pseudomonadota bacterium]